MEALVPRGLRADRTIPPSQSTPVRDLSLHRFPPIYDLPVGDILDASPFGAALELPFGGRELLPCYLEAVEEPERQVIVAIRTRRPVQTLTAGTFP